MWSGYFCIQLYISITTHHPIDQPPHLKKLVIGFNIEADQCMMCCTHHTLYVYVCLHTDSLFIFILWHWYVYMSKRSQCHLFTTASHYQCCFLRATQLDVYTFEYINRSLQYFILSCKDIDSNLCSTKRVKKNMILSYLDKKIKSQLKKMDWIFFSSRWSEVFSICLLKCFSKITRYLFCWGNWSLNSVTGM